MALRRTKSGVPEGPFYGMDSADRHWAAGGVGGVDGVADSRERVVVGGVCSADDFCGIGNCGKAVGAGGVFWTRGVGGTSRYFAAADGGGDTADAGDVDGADAARAA